MNYGPDLAEGGGGGRRGGAEGMGLHTNDYWVRGRGLNPGLLRSVTTG